MSAEESPRVKTERRSLGNGRFLRRGTHTWVQVGKLVGERGGGEVAGCSSDEQHSTDGAIGEQDGGQRGSKFSWALTVPVMNKKSAPPQTHQAPPTENTALKTGMGLNHN